MALPPACGPIHSIQAAFCFCCLSRQSSNKQLR
jgi:hypothetical protein